MVSGVTAVVVTMFLRIYSENSDFNPITISQPQCPPGYCALGDYAQRTGSEAPSYGATVCLKQDNKLVRTPLKFTQIWSSEGGAVDDEEYSEASGAESGSGEESSFGPTGRSRVLAFWRAVPPSNQYTGLGDVVTSSYEQPIRSRYCVVHNSVVLTARRGRRVWVDNSGVVSLWAHAQSTQFLNLDLFVANGYRGPPADLYFRTIVPEVISPPPSGNLLIEVIPARDLNLLLRDPIGEHGYEDISVYVPQPPIGFVALGQYAERGIFKHGSAHVLAVKATGGGALVAHPIMYKRVWDTRKSAKTVESAIWRPIPPPGYHCLGDIATVAYAAPSTNTIVCLHWSLVRKGRRGDRVWWNRKSPLTGSDSQGSDVTVWRVGGGHDCEAPNTFVANPGFQTPSSERLLFKCVLRSNSIEI
ncbi:predicted protein [Nematostella vectensis]|uniref:Uncharacterized protein n=1 Tax=Nematostella vectensis TaxID=45351 RepID=A7SC30_NEMVE|nr:uncharacterized protein LOC5510357 [Nematostella vectensis]EDO38764.1 predicted protein [Nematostella vectensis]|eukprot:XP_001630827.1 predicted protein [Nematostella vectensis]